MLKLISSLRDPASGASARARLSKQVRNNLLGYAFVSPWLISLLVFTAYPVLASFYFAMTKYTILNPPEWVGLDNFKVMFTQDPLYWKSVSNTVYYTVVSVPLGLIVALLLAILLNQRSRGIGLYRTAYYLPSLMPAVAGTLLWSLLLNPQAGLVNAALEFLGLPKLGWLYNATWAIPALILMSIWSGAGGPMLIFLAGLKDIPQALLDAALIDGANTWQRYRYVILPLLTPSIFFNLIIGVINSFQVFAIAFVASSVSRSAGPLNSLLVYMVYLYRNGFRYFNMGYASAMALVMFIMLVVLSLAVARSARYWVHYEAGWY